MKYFFVLFLLLLPAKGWPQQAVPCELDPFCEDADGPVEVPADDGVLLLVIGGSLLAFSKIYRSKKNPAIK